MKFRNNPRFLLLDILFKVEKGKSVSSQIISDKKFLKILDSLLKDGNRFQKFHTEKNNNRLIFQIPILDKLAKKNKNKNPIKLIKWNIELNKPHKNRKINQNYKQGKNKNEEILKDIFSNGHPTILLTSAEVDKEFKFKNYKPIKNPKIIEKTAKHITFIKIKSKLSKEKIDLKANLGKDIDTLEKNRGSKIKALTSTVNFKNLKQLTNRKLIHRNQHQIEVYSQNNYSVLDKLKSVNKQISNTKALLIPGDSSKKAENKESSRLTNNNLNGTYYLNTEFDNLKPIKQLVGAGKIEKPQIFEKYTKHFSLKIPLDDNTQLQIRYIKNNFYAKIVSSSETVNLLVQNISNLTQQIANLGFSKTVVQVQSSPSAGGKNNGRQNPQDGNNKHKNADKVFSQNRNSNPIGISFSFYI